MGLTLAHPAHSVLTRACEEGARAHARVRASVHGEPLPSRRDASLAPHCAALGFEVAAARFEYCAVSAPREAAHLRWHEVRTGVWCLPSHGCVARAMLRSLRQS